jgi:hypothetical protein
VATTILTVGTGGTYSTIQAAVDAAGNGDTILIAAGTYREQVTVNGKDIMACTRFRRHSPKLIPPAVRTPLGSCNRS